MAGIIWSDIEESILVDRYGKDKKAIIQKMLPTRTWAAIKLHAKFLRLKYFVDMHEYVEGDLSVLLDNSPESFYWMGFLAADGYFFNNRLKLTLAESDADHVIGFANFIKCKNHRKVKNGYGVAVQDSYTVPKILKKYDLQSRKTYNPPDVTWMKPEVCIPFFIGFVDGDGSIGFQHGRKDCILRIKNHSSWMGTIQNMVDLISGQARTSSPKVKLTKAGYANVNVANSVTLKFLKKQTRELNLPVLERKWNKIDETFVSRMEQSIYNAENVLNLKSQGVKNKEIALTLGLSQAAVSVIIKKSKFKEKRK